MSPAATELLQEDNELASAYSAYTEARRRLTEKFKNRGFWSTSKSSFTASKGKGIICKRVPKGEVQLESETTSKSSRPNSQLILPKLQQERPLEGRVPLQNVRSLHNRFVIDSINSLRKFANDDSVSGRP